MATNDGSMATLTEDWIVTQIRAIQIDAVDVFEDADALPWEGSLQKNAEDTADELLGGKRNTIARVRYRRDSMVELEAGDQRHEAQYDIFIGIRNEREGAARRGDGTTPGTNVCRDLLYAVLHNKRPDIGAHGRYTDLSRWGGSEVAYNTKGAAILYALLRVDEVPAA